MSTWDRKLDLGFRGWKWVFSALGASAIAWVILLGTRAREAPSRCIAGFEPMGSRCCAPGQGFSSGQCVGLPERCPEPFVLVEQPTPGCVHPPGRVYIEGGSVTIGPTDWDSVDVVEKHTVAVRPFFIDQIEVTAHRYRACEKDGLCPPLEVESEPGRPISDISAKAAQQFCASVAGRLPTPAEWIFAASGEEANRYPWGPHGLVCRRAAFGLSDGPCAQGGVHAELAGLHPAGRTPTGIYDLAGNVAEWARTERGEISVHGGSFRSKNASELKAWSRCTAQPADDVGFRCVYPPE